MLPLFGKTAAKGEKCFGKFIGKPSKTFHALQNSN
jgi:hypothetical protein